MRLYITGDTHGCQGDTMKLWTRPFTQISKNLTREDCVVIVGDFGWCWAKGTNRSEEKALDQMERQPYTTLFIDGNHENFDRLYQYPTAEAFNGEVGVLRPHVLHLKQRGHIYNICGQKVWCMGGATSYDRGMRMIGHSWWPQEEPTTVEYEYGMAQLEAAAYKVDIVLTHDAPYEIVKYLLNCGRTYDNEYRVDKTALSQYLQIVAEKLMFCHWFFGHYHIDRDFAAAGAKFCRPMTSPACFSALYSRILPYPCKPYKNMLALSDFERRDGYMIWDSARVGRR